jgi:hypothetical protein
MAVTRPYWLPAVSIASCGGLLWCVAIGQHLGWVGQMVLILTVAGWNVVAALKTNTIDLQRKTIETLQKRAQRTAQQARAWLS